MDKECPSCEVLVSVEEMTLNSGVCAKCKSAFKRRHDVKKPYEPPPETYVNRTTTMEGTVFVDGHLEESVGFNYSEIDRGNPLVAELTGASSADKISDSVEYFIRVSQWCLRNHHNKLRTPIEAAIRFETISATLNAEMLDNMSQQEIGERHGVGKANICKIAKEIEATFGVHFRRSRLETSRRKFRTKTKQHHDKRKQLDSNKPATTPFTERLAAAYRRKGATD